MCILRGGIDAIRVENPQMLRKGHARGSEFVAQYERFIKKAK